MKTKQLPQGWKEVELGNQNYFTILSSGINKFNGEKNYLSTESIQRTKINKIECVITHKDRPSRANMQPILGSVWFAKMQSTLKVYSFDEKNNDEINKYVLSTGFAGIKVNEKLVYSKYIRMLLISKEFNQLKDNLCTGSTQKGINNQFIKKISLIIPPLSIQKKIVSILEKIENTKEWRKEADDLTKDYLKSIFDEMFGNPKTNTKRFDVDDLKNISSEFRYGTSKKSGEKGFDTLGIPNILGEKISLDKLNKVELNKEELNRIKLLKGDLLFVRTNGNPNYIGRCGVFDLEDKIFVFASYLIRCRLKENMLPIYLKYYLESKYGRSLLRSKCKTTAGQYNINTIGLGSLRILIPPIPLQKKFVSIVKQVEKLKEYQEKSNQEINNLFNALMQKVFRGEL